MTNLSQNHRHTGRSGDGNPIHIKDVKGISVPQTTIIPNVGGVIKIDLDEIGNVGAGEDNLITFTLPANILKLKGDTIKITAYGNFAANGANKEVKFYFGSTLIGDTGAGTPNGTAWRFEGFVSLNSAGNQKAIAHSSTDGISFTDQSTYSTPSEDETGTITIKCTGEASSNNDIIQQGLIVEYLPTKL